MDNDKMITFCCDRCGNEVDVNDDIPLCKDCYAADMAINFLCNKIIQLEQAEIYDSL